MSTDASSSEDYRRVLFHTAVLIMVCDGEIHSAEVQELRLASERTQYFSGLDFESEMKGLLERLDADKSMVIQEYVEELGALDLDPVQRLQVLELALRIVYADSVIHENEVRFCRVIQRVLNVPEPILAKRFGSVPFLSDSTGAQRAFDSDSALSLASTISLPKFEEFKKIGVSAKRIRLFGKG